MIYISDCEKYLAIRTPDSPAGDYDVVSLETGEIWFSSRYTQSPFPPFAKMVVAFDNHGKRNKNGAWSCDFTLHFADLDTSIEIIPGTGNTIIKNYSVRFKRRAKFYKRGVWR